MNHRSTSILLSLPLCLGLSACADELDDELEQSGLEHIYFDSDEVAEIVAEQPDATFLVDLSAGKVVHFDQGEEPFDYDRFYAQCPSMVAPIPMLDFMDIVDLDFSDRAQWNLRSDQTELDGFRAMADGGGGGVNCVLVCDPERQDCFWDCW